MLGLFSLIGFVSGIIFGIQVDLPWQFASILVWVAVINWGPWQEMEGLFPYFVCICFYFGVIVGDISWFIQTDGAVTFDWINNFGDLFKADK